MARRFIDISVALQAGIASDPSGGEPKIHYEDHQESIPRMLRHFPGMTPEMTDGIYGGSFANLPGATLTRIDDSAHFIMLDQPARFTAEVNAFLE